MTNMVLRELEASAVELAVLVALTVSPTLENFEDIFLASLVGVVQSQSQCIQGDDLQYQVNLKFEETFLVRTKVNTIVRPAMRFGHLKFRN